MASELLIVVAMKRLAVSVVAVMLLTQGCYLGRSPTVRHVAMGIDGALVVGGVATMATADKSSPDLAQSVFDGVANTVQTDVGTVALIAGIVGLLINLAVTPDDHKPEAQQPRGPAAVHVVAWSGLSLSRLTLDEK